MKKSIKKLCKILVSVTVLILVFSSVLTAVPFHPDIIEKYKAEGRLDELAKREQKVNEYTMMNSGRLTASAPSEGNNSLLVLMIEYPDLEFNSSSTPEFYEELLNGENESDHSMTRYYKDMSNGKLDLTIDVMGIYMAENDYAYYQDNARELVREAIDQAKEEDNVRFSRYDNDKDGNVDVIMAIHSGPGAETQGGHYIHSHRSILYTQAVTYDGVRMNDYTIQPEYSYSPGDSAIGVFAHEFGHILGLPDLYDTNYDNDGYYSDGVGDWSIMASGSHSGVNNSGDRPAPFLAWEKAQLGWIDILETNLTKNPNLAKSETINNNSSKSHLPITLSLGILAFLGLVFTVIAGIKTKRKNAFVLFLFLFLFILPTMISVYACNSNYYKLTISITPAGIGQIKILPHNSNLLFLPDTEVDVVAVPEYGWTFKEWGEGLSGSENPSSIKMIFDRTLEAVFEEGTSLLDIDYSYSAIKVDLNSNEYLLLENKITSDSDSWSSSLPGGGMLVTHIDEYIIDTYGDMNRINAGETLGVRVVEADGNDELLTGGYPGGESTDTFYAGNNASLTPSTTPNTDLNNGSSSGVSITNISSKGFTMTLDISDNN